MHYAVVSHDHKFDWGAGGGDQVGIRNRRSQIFVFELMNCRFGVGHLSRSFYLHTELTATGRIMGRKSEACDRIGLRDSSKELYGHKNMIIILLSVGVKLAQFLQGNGVYIPFTISIKQINALKY